MISLGAAVVCVSPPLVASITSRVDRRVLLSLILLWLALAHIASALAPNYSALLILRLMMLVSDAREAAWGVVQAHVSELDFDFGAYAHEHFARLRAAIASPRFGDLLTAAAA